MQEEGVADSAVATTLTFAQCVATMPTFLNQEKEDLQIISFFAWLRARVLSRPYYEVLLQVAR